MTRTRGRAPRGERVVAKVPCGTWKVVTMIAAVRTGGPFAAAGMVGAVDTAAFVTYVPEVLAPQLSPCDGVVMDDLGPHKATGIRTAVESAGAVLLYLPPYSPDYNPIERMWSKAKGRPRSLAARTVDALHEAIGQAFRSVTPQDCVGYFRHCGYAATSKSTPL